MINYIQSGFVIFFLLLIYGSTSNAQLSDHSMLNYRKYDLNHVQSIFKDSAIKIKKHPSPNQIMWRSIVLPGWGQFTNKDYWKLPILYAGVGICAYAISYNYKYYTEFKDAYVLRNDNDSLTIDKYDPVYFTGEVYSEAQLKYWRDYHRKYFELSIIASAGVYLLNVLDAYVSAHLKDFDISDDLSLRIQVPRYNYAFDQHFFSTGFTIKF